MRCDCVANVHGNLGGRHQKTSCRWAQLLRLWRELDLCVTFFPFKCKRLCHVCDEVQRDTRAVSGAGNYWMFGSTGSGTISAAWSAPDPDAAIRVPIPSPKIDINLQENFKKWQRTQEEMAKNASYHTRNVPKGPDPSESSQTFGRGVNGYFIVVMIAAGIGGFILAVHLYMRCRRPLSPEELALTDPWVRAQMQETAAANASARPPEPG